MLHHLQWRQRKRHCTIALAHSSAWFVGVKPIRHTNRLMQRSTVQCSVITDRRKWWTERGFKWGKVMKAEVQNYKQSERLYFAKGSIFLKFTQNHNSVLHKSTLILLIHRLRYRDRDRDKDRNMRKSVLTFLKRALPPMHCVRCAQLCFASPTQTPTENRPMQ